jgi:hypothetical protein
MYPLELLLFIILWTCHISLWVDPGFLFSQKKLLTCKSLKIFKGPSWPWSYDSWINNYLHLCNQCLSPLTLWVWILPRARYTTLCDKVCQWLVTCRWFSSETPVSSINETYRHDITEILLSRRANQTTHTFSTIEYLMQIFYFNINHVCLDLWRSNKKRRY